MPQDSSSGPLFVVGMWRSGTSLLYALLNQHPQIALMYEGELPVLWPLFSMPGRRWSWPERWDFWNSALQRHRIEPGGVLPAAPDLRSAAESVYKLYANGKGAFIWGDKSPNYYDCLTRLVRHFPQSRFIIIWRNPVGICRSVIRASERDPWFAKPGMVHRALLGCKELKLECDRLRAREVPVYDINYEELTADTEKVMNGVCQFLGIPFDPRMTSLDGADRSAVYEGDHHTLVKGDNIVPSSESSEVLSPPLKRKIERYTLYWKEAWGGEWPVFPRSPGTEAGKPTLAERFFDRAFYRLLRCLDFTVRLIYCFAPLRLLRAYRKLKATNKAKAGQQRVVSRSEGARTR